jgi:hypothetical protein
MRANKFYVENEKCESIAAISEGNMPSCYIDFREMLEIENS